MFFGMVFPEFPTCAILLFKKMKRRRLFIRNMQMGNHLEIFLICAVVAILVIRGFLELTGYPQLGDDDLHIAHMLWGGMLMLLAMAILLTFLGKTMQLFGAIIGGIGFGTFIDEVGKFVTQDNNYFYEPSVAIMYVIFILIFLMVRGIQSGWNGSQEEYLMNAIRELEEIALHDLDHEEKSRIETLLNKSDPGNPLVTKLREVLDCANLVPVPVPNKFRRLKDFFRSRYQRITTLKRFHWIIVLFFLLEITANFSYIVSSIASKKSDALVFTDWAQLASSLVSALLILGGIAFIRKSHLMAFQFFKRSILVSIFVTQVFVFYEEQFGALVGLVIDLLILIALNFMIENEEGELNKSENLKMRDAHGNTE